MPWNFFDKLGQLRGTSSIVSLPANLISDQQVARGLTGDPASGALIIDTVNAIAAFPTTYRALDIHYSLRLSTSNNSSSVVRFNNDSGTNYDAVRLQAHGGVAGFGENLAATSADISNIPGPTGPASTFATGRIQIPEYALTDRFKSFNLNGNFKIGAGANTMYNILTTGQWHSTSAITRISWAPSGGLAFADGSFLRVYGIT